MKIWTFFQGLIKRFTKQSYRNKDNKIPKDKLNSSNQIIIKNRLDMAKKTVITEVQDVEVGESILEFPQNRTLMVEHLTHEAPTKPEIVKDLKTVDNVFEHFKPNVDVEFQDMDGVPKKENLNFKNLGDFGAKGITSQSSFLQSLEIQKEEYLKIIKQLKSNKQLRTVIEDLENKQALISSIHALLKELEASK